MEDERKSSERNGLLWLRLRGSLGLAGVNKRGRLARKGSLHFLMQFPAQQNKDSGSGTPPN
jgi:hypothetical protein